MSDVFTTSVATAAQVDQARAIMDEPESFSAEFTTDPDGAPPATHFLQSGFIAEEKRTALIAAGIYCSDSRWTVVRAELGLTRVVPLE